MSYDSTSSNTLIPTQGNTAVRAGGRKLRRTQAQNFLIEQKQKNISKDGRDNEIKDLSIKIPYGIDTKKRNPLNEDFNKLVTKTPYLEHIQRGIGTVGNALGETGNAAKGIVNNLGLITQKLAQRSTTNPTATTIVAGGGSIVAGLLSVKSFINAFKQFLDPKSGPWFISALQTIIQGGVAVGLGAPFLGKGEISPFVKNVNGENIVELKSLLAGAGASALLGSLNMLAENRLPVISNFPIIGKLMGGISRDIVDGVKNVTTGGGFTANNPTRVGEQALAT